MAVEKISFAKFELAKARCQATIKTATIELAMLEIMQAAGGQIKAIELFKKLIVTFEDHEKDPYALCQQHGYEPDEMVGLRSW